MIRVLHVVSHMDRAGIETILMRYYKHIDKSKIQFDFLVNKDKESAYDKEILNLGGHIYKTCGLNPIHINKYKEYVKEILINNPDIKIIHGQNDAMQYPALKAASEINFPIRIAQSHNTAIPFDFKYLIKAYYKTQIPKIATHYFGCGIEATKYFFGEDTILNKNFTIMKNAIEIESLIYDKNKRYELRKKLNVKDSTYLIGHVGRFSEQKNHIFIIKLIEELAKTGIDFKVVLIGEGELKSKIKSLIDKKKLGNYVCFTGNISNVNDFYQAMDLFILPSKYEGLPLVGIEAQTADLPCLFSKNITNEVKITDNVLFLPLNINDWILEILEQSKINHIRKNKTEEIISSGYDIKQESKKLEELYIKLSKY